jgi:hypothetical protein
MPRCSSCNKFVSPEIENEPESDSVEVAEDGTVTGSVRIHNDCPDCSTELSEYTFDIEAGLPSDVDIEEHQGEGHELSVEVTSESRTDRYENKTPKGAVIRNPRYQKHMYGVEMEFEVTCSCGKGGPNDDGVLYSVAWEDEVQASGMDSLV